ncbi:uncharacterized protein MYCGRDRAFT_104620 [Zymoseptoria tritici IPO323]|uniref:Uncharacterized protein n=1 Tax=Zymoseptoria tritici (strain CBS 115943 / IPO323) TaxID=336722 RepID=F9XBS7_ZYMTI|nr:uncharacterized protein MYCGRDRAFT_104620 [Zymoseptoria tritici IPO323]EGP87270.1 hypothetical protein MYCGRDRAFT_104620 [Zymoseptoria tritici IPO323]
MTPMCSHAAQGRTLNEEGDSGSSMLAILDGICCHSFDVRGSHERTLTSPGAVSNVGEEARTQYLQRCPKIRGSP